MTAPGRKIEEPTGPPLLIEPLPFRLLGEPLDYLFADHFRERCLTQTLRRFAAEGAAMRREADPIIAYLGRDQPLHHADEEEDLFPLLRKRVQPGDDIGVILAELGEDHRRLQPMADEIIHVLAAKPAEPELKLRKAMRDLLRAYAASETRHIAIENGIVLVLARKRLTAADLKAMSRSMKARRGVND